MNGFIYASGSNTTILKYNDLEVVYTKNTRYHFVASPIIAVENKSFTLTISKSKAGDHLTKLLAYRRIGTNN